MNRKYHLLKFLFLPLMLIFSYSCTSYLENPFIDKKTGENIDLIVIDASVFPVRLNISLIDSITGTAVISPATISFTGKNHDDIITLLGKKQSQFNTSSGILELAVDPNVTVSKAEPLSFIIHVNAVDYPQVTKEFNFDSTGIKELRLLL